MKKYIYSFLLLSSFAWGQNEEGLRFKTELGIGFINHVFLGDNYLSKGHKKHAVGAVLKLNLLRYTNFILGFEFEKNTSKVADFAIGGNIDKTNMNSFRGLLSYRVYTSERFTFDPQIKYGTVDLRQKSGSKFYGNQKGSTIGIGVDVLYNFSDGLAVFSNVGYNYYHLNVNTTPEFKDYFNHSHSINLTIGLKLN
ncbi:outer membrane beta-barrel protein [Flavobacterium sp. UBA6135]|uniref:outer membrane beta-barrel protein n=1 Tax=Flavobacterium sp. UBA6135 TaxID=1946553 RepID=UPI0025BE63BA|nr:outer membrane beta-barrel protein [Flavobacterium sp. UBA6135]